LVKLVQYSKAYSPIVIIFSGKVIFLTLEQLLNAQFPIYFTILAENRFDEEIRSDICDLLRLHADEVKAQALDFYRRGVAAGYMLEILSRVKARDEEVYTILTNAFLTYENIPMHASYLASYGDERALKILLKKIEDHSVGFIEFQELKYAIEALGGEYDEPRDFSGDKDYLAVEVASSKMTMPSDEALKS